MFLKATGRDPADIDRQDVDQFRAAIDPLASAGNDRRVQRRAPHQRMWCPRLQGGIERNGLPLAVNDTFTQADLDVPRRPMCDSTRSAQMYEWTERQMGDFSLGRFGWLLEDVTPLPEPIPFNKEGFALVDKWEAVPAGDAKLEQFGEALVTQVREHASIAP